MAGRSMWIILGLLVLGVILLAVGAVLTPGPSSFTFPAEPYPNHEVGQSLIALGLTFILTAIGYFLASSQERMLEMMEQ